MTEALGAFGGGVPLRAVLVDAADLYTDHHVTRVRSLADLPALLGLDGR